MASKRPAIPRSVERAVLAESGHRCAIPTCRQTPVEIHHIVTWAKVKEHAQENLIALCPTDRSRAQKKQIDRQSMLTYKRNLGLLTSRYGDLERRLLDLFAQHPGERRAQLDRGMDFEFMYLLQDGLLREIPTEGASIDIGGVRHGPTVYALTDKGVDLVRRWREGRPIEDQP
jgi:predicted Fe-S protein YdhL (DUF1289 family)